MDKKPQKDKKPYTPPAFRIARLEVGESVLSSCRISGTDTPYAESCKGAPCYNV